MQLGAEQRLVGVDVADPGDPRLVEQERLQRRAAVGRELEQPPRRQLAAKRLDPEPGGEVGVELVAAEHDRVAEPPRVGEPQLRAVVEDEPRPQVARVGVGLVEAGRAEPIRLHQVDGRVRARPAEQQVAGHPQVHDQRRPVVELDEQVLAAAPDRLDPPPGERLLDAVRQLRARPPLVEDLGDSIVRPRASGSSWRRTVSTSGSSGIPVNHRCYQARMQIVDAAPEHLAGIARIYDAVVVSSSAT